VTFINTNGMAFIGPGSEWFWTAISGLVLGITFVAIYRQLRIQRDAAATQQLNEIMREWSSERLARAKLTVLLAFQAGTKTDDLPNRAVSTIGFFWQKVGYLVRRGHVNHRLVSEQLGDQVQWWWTWLSAWTMAHRAAQDPSGWQHFEWLAAASARLDAKRGIVRPQDTASLAEGLPSFIEHFAQAIEIEEALRTVTVRLTPTPIPVIAATRQQHASRREKAVEQ
jgi:hypothetical protein